MSSRASLLSRATWRRSGPDGRITVHCNKGLHRANVIARHVESLLNTVTDKNGARVFNAKHFALCHATHRGEAEQVLADAKRWWFDPWCVMTKPTTIFGYEAATQNPRAMDNWASVQDWVHGGQEPAVSEHPAPPEPSQRADVYPREPEPVRVAAHFPREPSVPPTKRQRLQQAPLPPPAPPAVVPSSAVPSGGAAGSGGPSTGGPISGEGAIPPWVTFERDARVWDKVMQEHGVEETSRQEVFLLATHSEAGWRAANSLLAKLSKKKSDGFASSQPKSD